MALYKIFCKNENIRDFYIGSTKNFNVRKGVHKYYCNQKLNIHLYNFINSNDGWENFKMEIIQTCDLENLKQLENELIYNLNPSLNCQNPLKNKGQYKKKYYQKNSNEIKEKAKRYYQENKKYIIKRNLLTYYKKKLSV